jgi:RNA polymerase sigma factor for flagellar operon FliA
MLQAVSTPPTLSPELARRMTPSIRRIAHQLARRLPRHVSIDDLIAAGFHGLCVAYTRFDPAKGESFESYAEFRIRGAMLDELRALDPLSRDQRTHATRITHATRVLQLRLGRAPAADEVAAELGVSLDAYWELSAASTIVTVAVDDDPDRSPSLPDLHAEPADEHLSHKQTRDAVRLAVAGLPPRLRSVVELHYGEGLTLRQIGLQMGVTESRVCQILSDAVSRIREHYQARADDLDAPPKSARRPRRIRAGVAALAPAMAA